MQIRKLISFAHENLYHILCFTTAFSWGNPKRLLYPTDSNGNSCGEGDFSDRKYLFFFDLLECIPTDITSMFKISSCPTQQICVSECPKKNMLSVSAGVPNSGVDQTDLFCRYETQKV